MKKLILAASSAALVLSSAVAVQAQTTMSTVFEVLVGDPAPAFFETTAGNTVRGGSLNIGSTIASGESIIIPSRNSGTAVHVVDATTGVSAHTLDLTGVAGGVFTINAAAATPDGKVFVSNLITTPGAGAANVYYWTDDAAATVPVQIADDTFTTSNRFGDAMGVVQDGNNIDVYVVGNNINSRVVRISSTDGGTSWATSEVGPTGNYLGVDGDTPGGSIFLGRAGDNVYEYNQAGTLLNTLVTGIGSRSGVEYERIGNEEYLAVASYSGGSQFINRVYNITDRGNVTLDFDTPAQTINNANGNGTVGVSLEIIDSELTLTQVATNNLYARFTTPIVVLDGILDSDYAALGTVVAASADTGFGSTVDASGLYFAEDNNNLYFFVKGRVDTSNNNGIMLLIGTSAETGIAAGTPGVGDIFGGHAFDGDGGFSNITYAFDFEVDHAFVGNPGSSANFFIDSASVVGGRTTGFEGNPGLTGGVVLGSIAAHSFDNSGNEGGADASTGWEVQIPRANIGTPGTGATIQAFAVIVSDTAFFSSDAAPANLGGANPGFDTDWSTVAVDDFFGTTSAAVPVEVSAFELE